MWPDYWVYKYINLLNNFRKFKFSLMDFIFKTKDSYSVLYADWDVSIFLDCCNYWINWCIFWYFNLSRSAKSEFVLGPLQADPKTKFTYTFTYWAKYVDVVYIWIYLHLNYYEFFFLFKILFSTNAIIFNLFFYLFSSADKVKKHRWNKLN